jgi:hypothetical protein
MTEDNNEKGPKGTKSRKGKEKGGPSEDKLGAGSGPLPKAAKWIAVTIAVPVLVGGLNYVVQKALDPALDDPTSNGRRSGKPSGNLSASPRRPDVTRWTSSWNLPKASARPTGWCRSLPAK